MAIHQHEKDQDESQTTKKKKKKTTTTTTAKSKKDRRRTAKDDHDGSDGHRASALLDDSDDRFAAALTRPRFLPAPKQKRTVEIDERFAAVLTDERFRVGGGGVDGKRGVDKYGRRRSKTKESDDAEEGLRSFYTIKKKDDDDEKEDDDDDEKEEEDDDDEDEEDEEPTNPDDRLAYLTALSRGEIEGDDSSTSSSSSSSSDDDGDFSDDEEEDEEAPTLHSVLDPHGPKLDDDETEVELTHESSPYLAVTNLDWSHMRAVDLYAVLSSFAPPGSLRRVRVFPSDFGREQMAKEERHGPDRAIFKTTATKDDEKEDPDDGSDGSDDDDEEDENDDPQLTTTAVANTADDDAFDTERLRRYEASKLRYYFAVAEFESDKAADVVYDEVDGVEMERTSAAVDLRCVPREALADVVEGRPLRDQADALPSTYAPPDHVVAALQRTRLRCTWDEEYASSERVARLTDHEKWKDGGEDATDDLAVYMASDDDSDDDDDEGDKQAAMRKMLGLDDDDDDENDEPTSMQVTYHPGKKDLEDKIRNKLDSKHKEEQTPWEKLQQKLKDKKKEKRKARKERLAAAEKDNDDEATGNNNDLRDDDFFLTDETKDVETNDRGERRRTKGKKKRSDVATNDDDDDDDEPQRPNNEPSTKEELELLLAGDDEVEAVRDYDMRGLVRADKHRDKKLRGVRGKKEARRAKALVGQNFELDLKDERFSALLDGADDRFGVDVTDSLYKETPAMREVLRERTERRKKRRREGADGDHDGDDDHDVAAKEEPSKPASDGAKRGDDEGKKEDDLSGLVKSLKSKVNRSDGRSRKKKKKTKK